jgi:lysophospholipase L1-like esterase
MRDGAKLCVVSIALCVFLTVAFLAGLEGYLRLTVPASSQESIFEYTLETRRYKVMKSNASITAWGKELRTNELGFRDGASTIPPKQRGEFRIIVLGDSFTVSPGVDYHLIYTSQLQKKLEQRFPNVKIINLAVGGYNIIQYDYVLEEVGLALEPDMVLVAAFPDNDFSNETYDENYLVASGQAPAIPNLSWYEKPYVYRAYGRVLATMLKRLFRGDANTAGAQAQVGWDQNTDALKRIARTAGDRNIPVVVALLPHTWNFKRQRDLFGRVEKFCAQQNLACLNLLEPFIAKKIDESSVRLHELDLHPNASYNAVIADELAPYLSKILPAQYASPIDEGASSSRVEGDRAAVTRRGSAP